MKFNIHKTVLRQNKASQICMLLSVFILLSSMQKISQQQTWKAPNWADTLKPSVMNKVVAAHKGKVLFEKNCSLCHGNAGKGDGIGGINLKPRPKDLTSEIVQSQSDGAIYWKITTGNAPMASYRETLKDAERWQLVIYIRKLKSLAK